MTPLERKEAFLGQIKGEGRSSPAGYAWHEFYEFLMRSGGKSTGSKPPVPLILAADGASNRSKYGRLSEQLEWAMDAECLDVALEFLQRIPRVNWNQGSLEDWDRELWP